MTYYNFPLILGAPSMVNSCFKLLRKGAKIVLIGLPKDAIHIDDPLPNVIFKSLTLTTVHGRRIFHTWEQCESLIKQGKVNKQTNRKLFSSASKKSEKKLTLQNPVIS